jgi:hypothetical protein
MEGEMRKNARVGKWEELERIANILRVRRNDTQALIDFQVFVHRLAPSERKQLAQVLMQMIAEAR